MPMNRFIVRTVFTILLLCGSALPPLLHAQNPQTDKQRAYVRLKRIPVIACKDTAEALSIARTALEQASAEKDTLFIGRATLMIGVAHDKGNNPTEARTWYERALRLFEIANDAFGASVCHYSIARTILRAPAPNAKKDFSAAERHFREAEKFARRNNLKPSLTETLFYLARSVQEQDRHVEAIDLYNESAALAAATGNLTCRATCLQNIASLLNIRGDMDSVLICLRAVIPIARQTGDTERLATGYTNLANVLKNMGRMAKAETALRNALSIAQKSKDPLRMAQVLGSIWAVEMDQGKHLHSIETYRRALHLLDSTTTPNPYEHDDMRAGFQRMIGACYDAMYRYARALEHYRAAAALYDRIGERQPAGRALVLRDIGYTYYQLDQLDRAKQHLTHSLRLSRELREETEVATSLLNLSRVYKKQDSLAQARKLVRKALEISRRTGSAILTADARRDLGGIALEAGRYERAEEYLLDAVRAYRELKRPSELSTPLVWLARCRSAQGRGAATDSLLHEAERLAASAGIIDNLMTIARLRAERAEAEGRLEDANRHLKKFLLLKDSLETGRQDARFQNLLVEFDAERTDHEIAQLTSERQLQQVTMEKQQETMRRQQLEAERHTQALALLSQQHEIQQLELSLTDAELQKQRAASEEQKQRLALADKDRELQAQTLARETLLRNVAIAGFVLLALITLLIVRALRLRRRESEARAAAAELQAQAARSESLRVRAESAEREEAAQRRFSRQLLHAQEEERQRIASDLHDSLAQKLVVIQNRATLALQRPLTDAYAARQFEHISATATDTVSEV